MFGAIAKSLFGTANERILKNFQPVVERINGLEKSLEPLSDDDLAGRTGLFRERLEKGEPLDDLLPEAFATVREAAKRTLGQRHFDVQLVGGMVLHQGKIAEMKTGEGKTLVATLAAYLNALPGKGTHIITVNDYLAKRDSEWMGQVYNKLGLDVGVIVHGLDDPQRREAYGADVTYGTNNEFGFDYLRDNMKFLLDTMVQREHHFAIVDEVDSILIDEARTPLIISGPAEDSSDLYRSVDKIIPDLVEDDYEVDEKARAVSLEDQGVEHAEELMKAAGILETGTLYDIENVALLHHMNQGLRAHKLFLRDTQYVVKDDKVVIVDEFTGRMMEGRRFSEGQHQALEAKEGVTIQPENQTLASITFQNYFRLYDKLAGMTGTALTEAEEFASIYKLEVIEVATNVDIIREDNDDEVYRTAEEKYASIVKLVEECRERGQPILVGTVSIEKSEVIAELLKRKKIPHQVLNARHHDQEANIIAMAGRPGAVTVATNMAGRGTDIQLGGNLDVTIANQVPDDAPDRDEQIAKITAEIEAEKAKVIAAGGLYIIGTERHESRRIDNQLRGRAGRQGDPGTSTFFLSLEDDLMRIFGSERMDSMLRKLGLKEGEAIIHPWVNKALEKAQQKVEARNFEIRKNLLKYDDVMNDQRKVVYEQRKELMRAEDVADTVADMRIETIEGMVANAIPENAYQEEWDISGLATAVEQTFGFSPDIASWANEEGVGKVEMTERLVQACNSRMAEKVANYGPDLWRMVEKNLLLQVLDQHWKDHLFKLDHLKQGIGLRAYGQRDPLNEYKGEAFEMFTSMLSILRSAVTSLLAKVELSLDKQAAQPSFQTQQTRMGAPTGENEVEPELETVGAPAVGPSADVDQSSWGKVSRNAACPCGSGRKYKHCHGAH
ncbi:MAG: preprotein translocase subunit SecA [Alphaproteobacteria bacterium]|jgi:preprotein translocase subunit SecA|nr:preprotein translocase subunit SecA [Alphaproteobacteria bacterium]MBT5860874.1 preprotein translocase subunit SecA [Alphaproteobacteria bacterium]